MPRFYYLKKLNSYNFLAHKNTFVLGFQERVVTLLTHIKTQNDQILTILSQKSGQENVQSDFEFPIKTLEALDATEELLQNKTKYDNLVRFYIL